MNKNLKKIQDKIDESYIFDKYKALVEMVNEGELSLKFLETQVAIDLLGSDRIGKEKEMTQLAVNIRKAEKEFLESLI